MSNAAILFHPDGYDTRGTRLMGRHSAGEGFLKGVLRYADVDRIHLWNITRAPAEKLTQLVARIEPPRRPIRWLSARGDLRDPGVVYFPGPMPPEEAWLRRPAGPARYARSGVTHTPVTHRIGEWLGALGAGPFEPWDALICTSRAGRRATERQFALVREDLSARRGATRFAQPMLATIPLGIHA